jgi:Outer membrane protein beta-barrel domain
MGRVWVLSVLLIWFCGPSWIEGKAQHYYEEDPKVFSGGLIAGANFTQVDGDTYYGYHKLGLNIGGLVYVHFSKVFAASMELIYSQKGSRGETVIDDGNGTYVEKYFMNLNYVEVPLLLHLVVKGVDVAAGGSYGYLVKSSEWVETDYPIVVSSAANYFNSTDINYIIGLGYKVYKQLYAEGRFQYSLLPIRPTDRVPVGFTYGNAGQFNNMISLRFVYYF